MNISLIFFILTPLLNLKGNPNEHEGYRFSVLYLYCMYFCEKCVVLYSLPWSNRMHDAFLRSGGKGIHKTKLHFKLKKRRVAESA